MAVAVRDEHLQIDMLSLGPFGTNCYIVTCRRTGESVAVDAPGDVAEILKGLKGTDPRFILITHTHMDHLGALSQLKSELGIPVAVHTLDAKRLPLRPEILLGDGGLCNLVDIDLGKFTDDWDGLLEATRLIARAN